MIGCNELRLGLFTHQDVTLKVMQPIFQHNTISRVNNWREKWKSILEAWFSSVFFYQITLVLLQTCSNLFDISVNIKKLIKERNKVNIIWLVAFHLGVQYSGCIWYTCRKYLYILVLSYFFWPFYVVICLMKKHLRVQC